MFTWNPQKNDWLKEHRGVCFDDVMIALEKGKDIAIIDHPSEKYVHQKILLIEIDHYIYEVPFVEKDYFLKTLYPSRKFTKKYLENLNISK
jgi:hypothetical protein